jgi:penicillin amidase
MTTMPLTRGDVQAALPDVSNMLHLEGLDDTIAIYRDGYGIPHVKAQTSHDAFFGQGFVTAQDRLWHMDYDRHLAYGRWAEFAGATAVASDTMMRRFRIDATVQQDYQAVNTATKTMLDAYTAGVNAFLATTETLPIEYRLVAGSEDVWSLVESWQPWDCLAVFKVRHILMGVFEGKLWRARLVHTLGAEKAASLLRGYQPGHLIIVPPGVEYDGPVLDGLHELQEHLEALDWLQDDPQAGSNNWAVAGSRTASGKPLLAGDPHRALDTPNVYYQNHIACPEFDVIGLSFPGCPGFPHFGHNGHVAWCVTHAGADYQDLYVERFRTDGFMQYEFKGAWQRAEVHHEVIQVRDGQPVELDVTVTHHGPIIAGDPAKGHGIAFKYTATAAPNVGFQCLLPMLQATSVKDMDEAMREWVDPCNNLLCADVHGNIAYLHRGQVPQRPMANAWLPVPGWTGEYEWQGHIPFAEWARVRNPDTGYIVTANNRIAGKDYPYYIALDFAPEYRARRIMERLAPMRNATVADMAAVHAERVSIPAQTYVHLLSQVQLLDTWAARAQDRLHNWNGAMEQNAVAPTIYSAFRLRLHRMIIEHLVGPALAQEMFTSTGRGAPSHLRQLTSQLVTMAAHNDTTWLPVGMDWTTLATQALVAGIADLRRRLGDDMATWQWGLVHHTQPRHPLSAIFPDVAALLDPPAVPLGGDGDTPQAAGYAPAAPYVMTTTSVARYVFDTADWHNSRWIVPLGVSGHSGSPHYADQAPIWGEIDLIPMLYDWQDIIADAESAQQLEPVGRTS